MMIHKYKKCKAFGLGIVISFAALLAATDNGVAGFVEHKGGPSIKSDMFADNLLASFDAIPVLDYEQAARFPEEYDFFTLDDGDKLDTIKNRLSDPKLLKGQYSYKDDIGNTNTVSDEYAPYYHTYYRLEELRNVALSYKPEPDALKQMRHDAKYKNYGTALFPGNEDKVRSFTMFTQKNSENTKTSYKSGAVRPGIRQVLFYNRDGYKTLDAMPIGFFTIDTMRDLRKDREVREAVDNREPLKIAAWFETKMLMPIQNTTIQLPKETITIAGGESVGQTIARNRRASFLQETIVEAIKTTAYVQIKSADALQFLGFPNAESSDYTGDSLMKSLVGSDVNFVKTDKGYFTFDGPFLSGVTGANNSSVDLDLNSSIRLNFVARDVFSQMLSMYQQVLAMRLKLMVVYSAYRDSPKVNEDDSGKGLVRQTYEEVLEKRKQLDSFTN